MKRKFVAISVLCFATSVFLWLASRNVDLHLFLSKTDHYQWYFATETKPKTRGNPDQWLIYTETCQIMRIDPMNATIRKVIKKLPPFNCTEHSLVYLSNEKLFVNTTVKNKVFKLVNATAKTNFHCCVSYLKRFPEERNDFIYRNLGKCIKFKKSIQIEDEFMKIDCFVGKRNVYTKYEVAVIRKRDVEARCNSTLEFAKHRGTFCPDQLSVLVLGVDSASRLNSQRHLKETRRVLQELGAVEFKGYNRVGQNTFPNMFAFLRGQSYSELQDGCWGGSHFFFDECRLLFDESAAAGYRTAFVENLNQFGLFTYAKKGFRRQPVDYYGRVFFNAAREYLDKSKGCLGRDVPEDQFVLQWGVDFQRKFARDLHFGYFWISRFSHDNLNKLQYVDQYLSRDIEILAQEGALNNTLLIVMSDHGFRLSNFVSTPVGKYEANLPFMYLLFPKWFREKHQAAFDHVRSNAENRLVTVFDLHHTVQDILYCSVDQDGPKSKGAWGISFFKEIPAERTCDSAGIPKEFCSCYRQEVAISVNDTVAAKVVAMLVDHLNGMIANSLKICSKLTLKTVVEVRGLLVQLLEGATTAHDTTYEAIFETVPCDGRFEGSVAFNAKASTYVVNYDPKRINMYGNSSSCIKDEPRLLPICCCI